MFPSQLHLYNGPIKLLFFEIIRSIAVLRILHNLLLKDLLYAFPTRIMIYDSYHSAVIIIIIACLLVRKKHIVRYFSMYLSPNDFYQIHIMNIKALEPRLWDTIIIK